MYPDDQTRRIDTRGGYEGGFDARYQGPRYQDPRFDDTARPVAERGTRMQLDLPRLIGSVLATALVAALAGWLVAWIVGAVFDKFGAPWAAGGNDPLMYGIYGAAAAIVAGVLWYLLYLGTPDPSRFFTWIVGLVIVAAVVLPLLVTSAFVDGIAAAIVHLGIGLPILALTGSFVQVARR